MRQLDWKSATFGSDEVIKIDDLVIDIAGYEARIAGRRIDLTHQEFELLRFLAQHRGRVFTRQALLERAWGYQYAGGTRTVDIHVRRVRSKLGHGGRTDRDRAQRRLQAARLGYPRSVAGRASIVGAAETSVGKVRDHNEDSHFIDPEAGIFVVCDGMGGHAAGEVASAIAVQTVRERWSSDAMTDASPITGSRRGRPRRTSSCSPRSPRA